MQVAPAKSKFSLPKKQIPTLLGLGVLIVALIAGVFLLPQGLGVFAPRATPQTTPKKIKLSNVTDNSFSVSFLTDESTSSFVKYGTEEKSLKSQVGDDRDQLSGTVGKYQLHHITVRGLKPSTSYYYVLGTGSNSSFDNNGAPFRVKTTAKSGAPSAAKTAYGTVLNKSGNPAAEAVVYLSLDGVGEMSALVKSSGSWAVPLSNARAADGSGYAEITDTDNLEIVVQGPSSALTSTVTVSVANSQPVDSITLGENTTKPLGETAKSDSSTAAVASPTVVDTTGPADNFPAAASTGGLESLAAPTPTSVIVDLSATQSAQVVDTGKPKITGKAAPSVKVKLVINSDTQIEQDVITDSEGNFVLDLSELEQTLEPGEHSATYTYTDPTTGEEVTQTVTFTVEQLAMADTTSPYGSGNPYDMSSTQSAQATASATRSAQVATSSSLPTSGSVGTTLALILGGLFFIMAGGWSFYLASQIEVNQEL